MKYYPDFHPVFTNGGPPEEGDAVNDGSSVSCRKCSKAGSDLEGAGLRCLNL